VCVPVCVNEKRMLKVQRNWQDQAQGCINNDSSGSGSESNSPKKVCYGWERKLSVTSSRGCEQKRSCRTRNRARKRERRRRKRQLKRILGVYPLWNTQFYLASIRNNVYGPEKELFLVNLVFKIEKKPFFFKNVFF